MVHASEWDSSNRTRATFGCASVFTPAPLSAAIGITYTVGRPSGVVIPYSLRFSVIIRHMDDLDKQILALLVEEGRRTYDDIGRRVNLSAPSVKRRVDRLLASGALEGFTAVVDHGAMGWNTEALVELFFKPGTGLDEVARILREHPEVVEAWSVTGDADAIARVRTEDNATLERLIMDLQRNGLVIRTRSQVVMSRLVGRVGEER
jgi:Lrp/AsnC family transcriptional regulator, leucine-responsive regulatory protein